MKSPFFSIILPTYNRASFLPVSVNSILKQTFTDWELIIVDDGSVDNTQRVIKTFKDPRIKGFYQSNSGVSAARNFGIEKSEGQYICFLDDDDEYLENHLSCFHSVISEHEYPEKLFCTNIIKRKGEEFVEHPFKDYSHTNSFNILPWTPAVCVHNNILQKHSFNESLSMREDHELFDRIRRDFGIITIRKVTVIVNVHGENSTADKLKLHKGLEECIYFYIRDRKRITTEELEKLRNAYYYLFNNHFSKNDYKATVEYFFKIMLIMPFILFRKRTLKEYMALAAKIKYILYQMLKTPKG